MTPPLPSPARSSAAHAEFASSLVPDLPLLMHGSGDVAPCEVEPGSVRALADLTATFVSRLVAAAVDAHDILTDGAGGVCPPPPPSQTFTRDTTSSNCAATETGKKRKRDWVGDGGDDFWDEPLPEPKVKKRVEDSTAGDEDHYQIQGSDRQHQQWGQDDDQQVPFNEWVGLSGVDVFTRRRRAPYASVPSAVGTQCFIFPVCHDAALYGRVMEVQAARRNVAPVLLDPVLMDMVRNEGAALVRGERGAEGDNDDDPEGAAKLQTRPVFEAVWPGLEDVLPIHRGEV
uniref:Uncharacterized protein n=1 Tax=Trieres chinensis TaxID=1514140 RepID=A0A7S2EC34_TRICV